MALSGIALIICSYIIVWDQAKRSHELAREIKVELDAIEEKYSENPKVALSKIKLKSEEHKKIHQDKPRFFIFYMAGQVFGLILSVSGFWLWYIRVQKFQDIILTNQARSLSDCDSLKKQEE